jgi:hypothetical protein
MDMTPPTRIWLAFEMFLMLFAHPLYSQYFSSSRAIGTGAFTAITENEHSLDWNPAGLAFNRDLEMSFTTFASSATQFNLAFQSASLAYAFASHQAAAFRVSPGINLEFAIPSTFILQDSSQAFNSSFDKRITYDETFAGGYAYSILDNVSLGVSFHAIEQKITDTQYSIDTAGTIRSLLVDFTGRTFNFDAGIAWLAADWLSFGAVVKNAMRIRGSQFPEDLSDYVLPQPVGARAGISLGDRKTYQVAGDFDDLRNCRIGGEWHFADFLQGRAGFYIDNSSSTFIDAIGLGLGGTISRVQIDLAYLKFSSQRNRKGNADFSTLEQVTANNLEYNIFTGDQISLTTSLRFGKVGPGILQIDYADMTQEIFPAAHAMYALAPVGKARVENVSSKPVDAKVSFFIDRYMNTPTETAPVTLQPGEVKEIPFFAVVNDALKSNSSLSIRDGEITVVSSGLTETEDHYQVRVLMHGRNDWNGDARLLRFFVTPGDSSILSFTRSSISRHKSELDTLPRELNNFTKAKILFNDFAKEVTYVNDPKTSQDNVQYPAETLRLHGGDCDDMTVTYSTMLSSIGIAVAFVDVVPPDHSLGSHIYMLFDTGIAPKDAALIGNNQKRYIVRKNDDGTQTIWIPVETTAIAKGFEEAWNTGATEYFTEVEMNLGLIKGWVKIIDVEIPQ